MPIHPIRPQGLPRPDQREERLRRAPCIIRATIRPARGMIPDGLVSVEAWRRLRTLNSESRVTDADLIS